MRFSLLLVILALPCSLAYSQSPVFSQYYTTSLYLNPALVGAESDILVGMNYRAQWNQIKSPYKTMQFSYMHPLIKPGGRSKHLGGIGISLLGDQAGNGSLSNTGINFSGAYNLHLSSYGNNILSFGVQSGVYRNALDANELQWGSQYNTFTGFDPTIEVDNGQLQDARFYATFNAGLMWFYRKKERYSTQEFSSYLGLSAYHLNRPNTSLLDDNNQMPVSLRAHGGMTFTLGKNSKLTPSFLVVHEYGATQINAGAYFSYGLGNPSKPSASILLGAWYRLNDAVIAHLGTEIKNVRIAFSYDRNVSSFNRFFGNNGSYEFSIQYRIIRKHKTVYFSTPLI